MSGHRMSLSQPAASPPSAAPPALATAAEPPAGPGRAVRLTMEAWPLTPIHIGDGTRLSPETYLLRGDELCRFNPARAVSDMTKSARTNYLSALDRGDLPNAQRILRDAVSEAAIVERLRLSQDSRRELAITLDDPGRRSGEVRPFIRTGGQPFIPGSSLKGALRTALASFWLPGSFAPPQDDLARRNAHASALQAAFGLSRPDDLDSDPLRFLGVDDIILPPGSTLIDQPRMMKRGGTEQRPNLTSVQMHFERLRCAADGSPPKLGFAITLGAPPPGWQGRRIDRATLLRAANRFHWRVWDRERERFFADYPATLRALDEWPAKAKLRTATGETNLARNHSEEIIVSYMLLRLGRFGHFESKSLDRVRQGYVPQARQSKWRQPDEYGASRTVIRYEPRRDGEGARFMPMGWLLAHVKEMKEIGA